MIKKVLVLIFVVFSISFGQINDSGNILNEEQKQKIEDKITEIEKNTDIVYYINLGRQMDETEVTDKSVVLDVIPDGKKNINVKLKFTQDIDTGAYEEEINNLLIQSEDLVTQKQYATFVLSVLDMSNKIVENIDKDKKTVEIQETKKTLSVGIYGWILIIGLIAVAIFITLKFIKYSGKRKRK